MMPNPKIKNKDTDGNSVSKRSKQHQNESNHDTTLTTSIVNKTKSIQKKLSPALKRKRKLQKKAKKQLTNIKQRYFSNDLETYLLEWKTYQETKEDNSWKFNKILQNWSLDNCLDKIKINKKIFKLWLSYLLTIKGGAIERLQSKINNVLIISDDDIVNDDSDSETNDKNSVEDNNIKIAANIKNESITKSMKYRAKKIDKLLRQVNEN